MPRPSRVIKELSDALLDLNEEAMLFEELDGFVAGVLVCPEMIPPSAWLPLVWNRHGDDEPVFENLAHANKLMGLVMEHYNDVALSLFEQPESYAPFFAIDERNGDVLWQLWIDGFDRAVKMRPEAWLPLMSADTRTADAWRGLVKLADIATTVPHLSAAEYDAATANAPAKIAGWIRDLNDWRLTCHRPAPVLHSETVPFAAAVGKVSRNAPCPCGSGKKYKRCCGLN